MSDNFRQQNGTSRLTDEEKMELFNQRVSDMQSAGQNFDRVMAFYKGWAKDYDQVCYMCV